jgi:hypothetical protein
MIAMVKTASFWAVVLIPLCWGSSPLALQAPLRTVPYRGKVIEAGDSNENIYQYYEEKLREYRDIAFSTSADWKILKRTADGIEISTLVVGDDQDCPYVRMRATMPVSAEKLHNFMSFANWKTFMPIINPFYHGMSVVKELNVQKARMIMARKLSTSILGFGKRDFSLLSVTSDHGQREDGVLVSGTISVIIPQQIPRYNGFTRAFQDMVCFYKPTGRNSNANDTTELTIMLRTDLNDSADGGTGGAVPMWLVVKTLGIAGTKAMQGLRKVVRKHATPQDISDGL